MNIPVYRTIQPIIAQNIMNENLKFQRDAIKNPNIVEYKPITTKSNPNSPMCMDTSYVMLPA